LRRPAGSAFSPGYYTAASDQAFVENDNRHLVRTYWNLTSEGAVRFMRVATSLLNRHGVPFVVKAVSDLAQVSRCDSVVLYLRSNDYPAAHELIEQMHAQVAEHLNVSIPALTKWVADGVGLAEDPNGEGSFGIHRCRLLAEGMVTAQENGARRLRERLDQVANSFARSGITLDTPYLRAGSTDVYEPLSTKRPRVASGASRNTSPEEPLATAARIGLRLCEQAHWYGDRCTWIAPHVNVTHAGHSVSFRSLGPDLYSGTSGLALFLAELHGATRHVVLRRTALGAIRHALSHAGDIPPRNQLGPYTGSLGIALIAARVGGLLGEDEVVDAARRLVNAVLSDPPAESEFDLISGKAGAIVALTLLRTVCDGATLVEFAARLGDELLATATKSAAGDSWPALAFPSRRHLTGYSHGTAGVGRAFLELFRITGEAKYVQGAERAFGYERHWFDRRAGNWPDFREDARTVRGAQAGKGVFQAYWCHGAAGIALSRLRAYEILGDPSCLAEARVALEATRKVTRAGLEYDTWNYTLCHGLTGNAEILEYGHAAGALSDRKSMLWLDVARDGVERYVMRNRSWPCGVSGAEVPSLMAGVAGIGYFYVRMHDKAVPSILCLREVGSMNGGGFFGLILIIATTVEELAPFIYAIF